MSDVQITTTQSITINGLELSLVFSPCDNSDALIQAKRILLNHYEESEK